MISDLFFRCFYCFEKGAEHDTQSDVPEEQSIYSESVCAIPTGDSPRDTVKSLGMTRSYGSAGFLGRCSVATCGSNDSLLSKGLNGSPKNSASFQSLTDEEKMLSLLQNRRKPQTQTSEVGQFNPDLYLKRDASISNQSSTDTGDHMFSAVVGKILLKMSYDSDKSDFLVQIIEAQDLVPQPSKMSSTLHNFLCEPFIRVSLRPPIDAKDRVSKPVKKTKNPKFHDQVFKFPITYQELVDRSLQVEVLDNALRMAKHHKIGETVIDLETAEIGAGNEVWMDLHRCQEEATAGELLCAITYLSHAERLTVKIVKAKNLRKMDITGSSDPYVKAWLYINGQRVKKRKTAVIKRCTDPEWNEAFNFNINPKMLSSASIRLWVIDKDLIGQSDVIGYVELSDVSTTMTAQRQWKDMLETKESVLSWLPLEFSAPESANSHSTNTGTNVK